MVLVHYYRLEGNMRRILSHLAGNCCFLLEESQRWLPLPDQMLHAARWLPFKPSVPRLACTKSQSINTKAASKTNVANLRSCKSICITRNYRNPSLIRCTDSTSSSLHLPVLTSVQSIHRAPSHPIPFPNTFRSHLSPVLYISRNPHFPTF